MSNTKTAAKAARSTSTKPTSNSEEHKYERPSDDKPCLGCGKPWVHGAGFCSDCYYLARKPKAEGKKGDELIAAVKAKLADTKQKGSKPVTAKKRAASKAQPVTTDDALATNDELYGEQEVPF